MVRQTQLPEHLEATSRMAISTTGQRACPTSASNLLQSEDYTSPVAAPLGYDGKFLSLCLVLRPQGSQENSPGGTTA